MMAAKSGKKRYGGTPARKIAQLRKPGVADPVDIHVGSRVRLRRTLLGLTQEGLADAIGLTFQQVQKYERGANRIGASRLYDMAHVLGVRISYFFEEMPAEVQRRHVALPERPEGEAAPAADENAFLRRETLELVRNYFRIKDETTRKELVDLITTLEKI